MGSDNFPRKFGGDDGGARGVFDNKIPDYPRHCHCGAKTDIALVVVKERFGPKNTLVGAASEFSNHDKSGNPSGTLRDIYTFQGHIAECANCYLARQPNPLDKMMLPEPTEDSE